MSHWRAAVARVFAGDPRSGPITFLGSAFLVGPKQLLTCRHVVDFERTEALFVSGPAWTGPQRITKFELHESRDVAILTVSDDLDRLVSPLEPWIQTSGDHPRDSMITLGGFSTPAGSIETPQLNLRSYDGLLDTWTLHTHISKGLSGGPALIDGRVVGVTQAREAEGAKTYIIPIVAIRAFLNRNEIWVAEVSTSSLLHQATPPPSDFVGREVIIDELIGTLTGSAAGRKTLALKGLGGVGKTTIARALCWDKRIITAFPDGILWTTLGQSADVLSNLHDLLLPLQTVTTHYETTTKASSQLRSLLAAKQCLLVIDDAWTFEDLKPFLVIGPLGGILLTTRDKYIALQADAKLFEIDVLSPETSRAYLRSRLEEHLSELPSTDQIDTLAGLLEYLPLALEIASIHLRDGMELSLLLDELSTEIGRLRALALTSDTETNNSEAGELNSAPTINSLITFVRALWPAALAIDAIREAFAHIELPDIAARAFLETGLELAREIHDHEPVTQALARTSSYADEYDPSPLLSVSPILSGMPGVVLRESQKRKCVSVKLREVWQAREPNRVPRDSSRSIVQTSKEKMQDLKDGELACTRFG